MLDVDVILEDRRTRGGRVAYTIMVVVCLEVFGFWIFHENLVYTVVDLLLKSDLVHWCRRFRYRRSRGIQMDTKSRGKSSRVPYYRILFGIGICEAYPMF